MKTPLTAFLALALFAALTACVTPEQQHMEKAKSGERTTTLGKALDKADTVPCDEYLSQLNQASMMYAQSNEKNAPDLQTVIKESQLPASELANCKYVYDPATGKVSLVR
jgi:hypothetical protein